MKKFVFIQIPRNAGKSINEIIQNRFDASQCLVNLKKDIFDKIDEDQLSLIKNYSYISGQVPYSIFNKYLNVGQYNFFAFLRNPIENLVSHLNWVHSFLVNKEIEKNLPLCIRYLPEKIKKLDISDKKSIFLFLESLTPLEFQFLDNPQTRFLRSNHDQISVNENDVFDAIFNIKNMIGFGFIDRINSDLEFIIDAHFPMQESLNAFLLKKENAAIKNINIKHFDEDVLNILNPIIGFDQMLYDGAMKLKSEQLINLLDISLFSSNYIIKFDKVSVNSIHGWVKLSGNKQAQESFDVFVDCKYVGQFSANNSRHDLIKAFGFNCGFDFTFKNKVNVKHGDYISITGSKTKEILAEFTIP